MPDSTRSRFTRQEAKLLLQFRSVPALLFLIPLLSNSSDVEEFVLGEFVNCYLGNRIFLERIAVRRIDAACDL